MRMAAALSTQWRSTKFLRSWALTAETHSYSPSSTASRKKTNLLALKSSLILLLLVLVRPGLRMASGESLPSLIRMRTELLTLKSSRELPNSCTIPLTMMTFWSYSTAHMSITRLAPTRQSLLTSSTRSSPSLPTNDQPINLSIKSFIQLYLQINNYSIVLNQQKIALMENIDKSSNMVYKRGNTSFVPFQSIQNLAKKRPSSTKLDLQKMYEESIELTSHYKKLMKQNQELKEEHQRVQAIKLNRQNLIAVVEKIVEQKSKELVGKQGNHFSWLVFKLNNKIYDLKAKIEAKDKAIRDITLSKESEFIRQKQTEIECLNEIIQFAKDDGLVKQGFSAKDSPQFSEIKQIVWMQQQIKEKQAQIIDAEKLYHQEEKQVRRLMQELAKKKAELKSIKEMESQYHRTQELYREEKRKKEQRIAGNKSYLQQLQNQRAEQMKKLDQLKSKYVTIEQQQNFAIANLQSELQKLKEQYNQKIRIKQETVIKFSEEKLPQGKKKEVKRVSYQQVKMIGKNLNYSLKLKETSHGQIGAYFTDQRKEQYSIKQVVEILKRYPFEMEKDDEALLLARYVVQDSGEGLFLQDMETSQNACIIKSILTKIIGQIKVYTREQAEKLRLQVGKVMSRFCKLVQQFLDIKDGGARQQLLKKNAIRDERNLVISKDRMQQALENSLNSLQNQDSLHEEIQFTVFYLFSWSRNLNQLQVNRLSTMLEEVINWPSSK